MAERNRIMKNKDKSDLITLPPKSRLIKFYRRPTGEKEIVIRGRLHGEKIEERFTLLEIEEMFREAYMTER